MTADFSTARFLRAGLILLSCYIVLVPYQYISWSVDTFNQVVVLGLRVFPVALSFFLLLGGFTPKRFYCWLGVPASVAVLFLGGIFFLGTLGSLNPIFGLTRLGYYALTGGCLFFIAFIAIEKSVEIFITGASVLVVIFIVSGLGLLEFFLGFNILYSQFFDLSNPLYAQFTSERYARRILSTLGHPVYLACLLVLFFPFFLYALDCAKKTVAKIALILALFTVFCTLFLTFSRGGWVACLISLFIYYWPVKRRLCGVITCVIVVIIGLTSFSSIQQMVQQRNTYQSYSREVKVGGRMHSYKVVHALIQESPFWGVGVAHYRFISGKYEDYDGTPDNAYLMILAEGGLVGFGVFALVLFKILSFFIKFSSFGLNRNADPIDYRHRLMDAYVASFIGFLVDSITCDAFHFPITRMMFWIVVGHGMGAACVLFKNQAVCFNSLQEHKVN